MRGIFFVSFLAAMAAAAPAWSQQPETAIAREIARELERKARAGEADAGFCVRASANLVRLTREQAASHLNRLLARPDQAPASLVYVIADLPNGTPACAYLAFQPVGSRDGKKCRPTQTFVCIAGRDCRAKLDDAICEVRPGLWD
ncbi:MAG TPA: hypothetical protein VIF14_02075 [Alphaproteobacteria bacterium]|jgi:hypothetical protein